MSCRVYKPCSGHFLHATAEQYIPNTTQLVCIRTIWVYAVLGDVDASDLDAADISSVESCDGSALCQTEYLDGAGVLVDGIINSPLLGSRPLTIDEHGNDFSRLHWAPRRTRTRTRAQELMHHSQIPIFMKRYCVVWHYRPQSRFKTAALSVFRLHNETVNIWSHAIGKLAQLPVPSMQY